MLLLPSITADWLLWSCSYVFHKCFIVLPCKGIVYAALILAFTLHILFSYLGFLQFEDTDAFFFPPCYYSVMPESLQFMKNDQV